MKCKTTRPDKNGWYYTFKMRLDGSIVIQQKNKKLEKHRELHVFGKENLNTFYEVFFIR